MKEIGKEFRILILEDVFTNAEVIERQLWQGGIRFVSKRMEIKEGFVKGLDHFTPDLVLADLALSSFNVIAALAIAREKYPEVPFLFVSGTMGPELAVEILKRGATDCVFKEKLSRLVPAVNHALELIEVTVLRKLMEDR